MPQSAVSEEGEFRQDGQVRPEEPFVEDADIGRADGRQTDDEEGEGNSSGPGARIPLNGPLTSTSRQDVASTSLNSTPATTSSTHAPTPALPKSLPDFADDLYLTRQERQELGRQWKKRVRLLYMCAMSSDAITSLMSDIKQNNVLITSHAFSCLPESEQTRLTEQQASLKTRLEDEKLLDLDTRALLIRLILPPIADETARERVAEMKKERDAWVDKEKRDEGRWETGKAGNLLEREFKVRDRLLLERHEQKQNEKQNETRGPELEQGGQAEGKGKENAAPAPEPQVPPPPLPPLPPPPLHNSPQDPMQPVPSGAPVKRTGESKRKRGKKKSKQLRKKKRQMQRQGLGEVDSDLDDAIEVDVAADGEDGELPGENGRAPEQPGPEDEELPKNPNEGTSSAAQDRLATHPDHRFVSNVSDGAKDPHTEMRVEAVRLRDEVAKMKSVLMEMREMSKRRMVQSERDAGRPLAVGSSKRKLEDDSVDDDGAWQDLSSAPASDLADVDGLHPARVELETLLRKVIDIRTHVETETSHIAIDGRIRVAFDDARTRRAAALEEKRRVQTADQEHFNAEVEDELAQITQQTAAFNTQIRVTSADLYGCRTRLDAVANDVGRQMAQSSETRKRLDQIQATIRSHGDLHAQNSAAISDIRAKLDACSREAEFHLPDSVSDPPSPPTQPIYPNPQEISDSLSSFMADSTQPLLDRARREIATLLEQNSRRMHHAVDSRMHHTLNAVENSIKRSMASHSRHSNSNPLQP